MVADALNRKSTGSISHLKVVYLPRLVELRSLGVRLELTDARALLAHLKGATDSRSNHD